MPEVAKNSDQELVEKARGGDFSACERLMARHQQHVYSIARRITAQAQDAEDVTQQAFISAVENLDSFRGEASFGTWIARIATHAALKVLRRRWATLSLEEQVQQQETGQGAPHPEYITDWHKGPAELAEDHEAQRIIDEALSGLEEKYRLVFVLRDIEGFSIKETAEQLGVSEGNVKIRLLRARLLLRERLTREFGDAARRVEPHRH